MLQMRKYLVIAIIFFTSSLQVYAGGIDGKVKSISYAKQCSSAWDGCVFFVFDTNIQNPASCQWLANPSRMALDYNGARQEQDEKMIEALTLAFENNFRVVVKGYNHCDIHANTESIKTVTVYRD